MSVAGEHLRTNKFSSVIVILVMLLSSTLGLINLDNAAASTSGNLSILEPVPLNSHISRVMTDIPRS